MAADRNGRSRYAPTLVWNQQRNRLFAFVVGFETPAIYQAFQDYGHPWTDFARMGGRPAHAPVGPPAGASFQAGDMELAFRADNGELYQGIWPRNANFQGWNEVTGGLIARAAPYILIVANIAWMHATRNRGGGDEVDYKIVRRINSRR